MNRDSHGLWSIESMNMWSKEYIDCNEPGYFQILADGTGDFVFGAVSANVDGGYCKETKRFEFSWEGMNDRDPVCGRGWFRLQSINKSSGKIFIHMGDESTIELQRKK